MIEIVAASPAHVGRIANRMREADREECEAYGRSPKEALRLGLRSSVLASTALVDGSPEGMFGVAPLNALEGTGRPWMLATDAASHCARELLDLGPPVIEAMHRRFARLENYVSIRNRRAIRMLMAWGFEIGDETMEFGGVEFREFWREAIFSPANGPLQL